MRIQSGAGFPTCPIFLLLSFLGQRRRKRLAWKWCENRRTSRGSISLGAYPAMSEHLGTCSRQCCLPGCKINVKIYQVVHSPIRTEYWWAPSRKQKPLLLTWLPFTPSPPTHTSLIQFASNIYIYRMLLVSSFSWWTEQLFNFLVSLREVKIFYFYLFIFLIFRHLLA